jgi:hypothetical protein
MKGLWIIVAAAVAGSTGCGTAPKREMRGPSAEEFTNPSEQYRNPPDVPSDRPTLTPKSGSPMPIGSGLPGGGFGSPGMSPGMGSAGGMPR